MKIKVLNIEDVKFEDNVIELNEDEIISIV